MTAKTLRPQLVNAMPAAVTKCMDSLQLPQALAEIFRGIQRANKYIDETAPVGVARSGEPPAPCRRIV